MGGGDSGGEDGGVAGAVEELSGLRSGIIWASVPQKNILGPSDIPDSFWPIEGVFVFDVLRRLSQAAAAKIRILTASPILAFEFADEVSHVCEKRKKRSVFGRVFLLSRFFMPKRS
jgi:hypothetical protein